MLFVQRRTLLASWVLFTGLAAGQILSAPSCQPGWAWSNNTLQQDPCKVTAYLLAQCNGGNFSFDALPPGLFYRGPSGPDNGDLCKCNTVVYNVISACAACQERPWIPWSEWSLNCTRVAQPGIFPESIPPTTRVPHWAYLPIVNDIWDNVTALATGDAPEDTGFSTSHHSHAGAIAGGVVGGLAGLTLVGLLGWFFLRLKKRRHTPTEEKPEIREVEQSYTLPVTPQKYYDPSDPTTFPPMTTPSPPLYPNTGSNHNKSFSDHNSTQTFFRGLPEI